MPIQDYTHCFGWDFRDVASEIHRFPHQLLSGNFDSPYLRSIVSRDAELPCFIDSQLQNEYSVQPKRGAISPSPI